MREIVSVLNTWYQILIFVSLLIQNDINIVLICISLTMRKFEGLSICVLDNQVSFY